MGTGYRLFTRIYDTDNTINNLQRIQATLEERFPGNVLLKAEHENGLVNVHLKIT